MQIRSPRTILAVSAALALTVSALAPTAAFAKGPGPGAGDCDGDCANEQPRAQQTRARDGSAQQSETQANAGGGQQVRAGNGKNQNTAGRNANQNQGAGQGGRNANQNQGAGRGQDDDTPRGPGNCEDCDVEMGELTVEQIDGLIFMANEEKMAEDVYVAFSEMYDLPTFERIADSEVRHQVAVDTVLERYGVENPAIDLPAGEFSDPIIASLYAQLVEQGSASLEEALAVSVLIEETDMADLEERMAAPLDGTAGLVETAPDVHNMYSHLLTASGHHLAAFQSQL